ncbi:MAG: transglycosylase domain-containing protein, partial [Xanthomonadales bacterium]|nr:transglycosylase domain-containing protein [Xanthomonadales bacterium]
GSTLTQQLVKNYFLDSRRTLWRKANEAVMAVLLERHYDKAEILEAYLNEVYLGQHGAHAIHGFGRAAEFYFDQPVDRLPPEQVALLVGMARGASLYNPWRNPERALERRNFVLGQFAETGLLTDDEAERLQRRPLGVVDAPRAAGSRHPAFLELVRRQLKRDYEDADLQTTGLRVFTTLAPSEQRAAEQALQQGLRQLAERGLPAELQGAIVLADTASGEVRAVVGDRHPGRSGFNRALDARRQVGSVIKPLVYLLALEHPEEYTLLTRIEDAPISLRQPNGSTWTPRNHDDVVHGGVNLLDALVHSYNLATVRLGMDVGVNNLVTQLRRLGVEADVPPVPATLLGAVELTPLEVAQVYQSLAAGGFSAPLRAVTAVLDPEGRPLNRYPLRMRPLERRDAIGVLNFALTRVVEDGTARALPGLLGRYEPIAGKTGTTNDRRDSWFVGYTADRVGVAWVGLDDHTPAGVTGSNAAMPVWAGLFRELPWEPLDPRLPEGASYAWVDPEQRLLSHPECPGAQEWAFIEGSQPREKSECAYDMDEDDDEPFWKRWLDD